MRMARAEAPSGRKLLEAVTATIAFSILAYASINYGVVLAAYAGYWSQRSPFGPLDGRQFKPVVILSVSLTPHGISVRLMRNYAEPGLLELTVATRLYTRGGGISFLKVRMRAPVGTIQELVFQGGLQEPLECAELVVVMNGAEVDRWSGCIRG